MKLPAIQYISQGETPDEHLANITKVCEGGCQWVQLRLKGYTHDVCVETAKQAKQICEQYGATLIINDFVSVAKQLGVGVHLGKSDEAIVKAKQELGSQTIVGGTANTLQDCEELIKSGADYIGLGPYKFTTTKKNLSPILGLNGYEHILKSKTIQYTPIVAIGGITQQDVEALKQVGVQHIAVSGLLTKMEVPEITKTITFVTKLMK